MDLIAVAEWSRYVLGVALVGYLAAWLALSSENGLRTRARQLETELADQPSREAVLVHAGQDAADGDPGADTGDGGVERATNGTTGDGSDGLVDRLWAQAEARHRVAQVAFVLATVVLATGVAMRGIGTGRMPWANMHEFSISAALVASIVYLAMGRTAVAKAIAPWMVLIMFVTLGLAVTLLYVPPGPLVPALQSYWLVIHVGLAVVGFALFAVAAVVNVLQIVAERVQRRRVAAGDGAAAAGSGGGLLGSLPSASVLDRLSYRLISIGFPVWTAGPLILGAIWAEVSWGRYWGWDPKEVWALITWLVYAAYLHARATAGWKGSRAAVIGLIGFATALFSYFGVNIFFTSEHAYGGL